MTRLNKVVLTFAAAILVGLIASPAKADPLFFSNVSALQNGGATNLDLFTNPGVTLVGPQISFLLDVTGTLPEGGTDTLSITYHEVGSPAIIQSFQIPFFGSINPPFSVVFSINSPGANPLGVAATLTIDLLSSSPDFEIPLGPSAGQRVNSQTYSFNVTQPVPEPTSLVMIGIGLGAFAVKLRRNGKASHK